MYVHACKHLMKFKNPSNVKNKFQNKIKLKYNIGNSNEIYKQVDLTYIPNMHTVMKLNLIKLDKPIILITAETQIFINLKH